MGNVRYVIDRVGNIVLAYDYDAWGKISVTPNAYYTLEHSPNRDYNANAISKLSDISSKTKIGKPAILQAYLFYNLL